MREVNSEIERWHVLDKNNYDIEIFTCNISLSFTLQHENMYFITPQSFCFKWFCRNILLNKLIERNIHPNTKLTVVTIRIEQKMLILFLIDFII